MQATQTFTEKDSETIKMVGKIGGYLKNNNKRTLI